MCLGTQSGADTISWPAKIQLLLKQDVLKSGDRRVVSKPITRTLSPASRSLPRPSQPLQRLPVVRDPDGNKMTRLGEMSTIGILKNILFSLLKRNRRSWHPLNLSLIPSSFSCTQLWYLQLQELFGN